MKTAIVVRGHMVSPRSVELDESVTGLSGDVEVVLRAVAPASEAGQSAFDLIAAASGGTRTKADIDRQVEDERISWNDR